MGETGLLATAFNVATSGFTWVSAMAGAGAAYFFAGPRLLKPDTNTAYVVTGFRPGGLTGIKKDRFVVKDKPAYMLKYGSSKEEVNLRTFSVNVERSGKDSLTLLDKIKAEISTDFFVRVDTEDSEEPVMTEEPVMKDVPALDETTGEPVLDKTTRRPMTKKEPTRDEKTGEVLTRKVPLLKDGKPVKQLVTGDEKIIRALRRLKTIDEGIMKKFLEPQLDGAIRDAAAQMSIEDIQSNRERFLAKIREAIDLRPYGLVLDNVALRSFRQAPLKDFNPDDYFDAQGLKKVTEITQESKKVVNEKEQEAQTKIAETNKIQEVERQRIWREEQEAKLNQQKEVERMKAEQEKEIKTFKENSIRAQREAEIEQQRQVGVAEEAKMKVIQVAQAEREKAAREAQIAKEKSVELAERDKKIALHAKDKQEAAAEEEANKQKAEAVRAQEDVVTARQVAVANREMEVKVIEAKQKAQEEAEGQKIAADAKVYVSQKAAEAAKTEAEGLAKAAIIEAEANRKAAEEIAQGQYAQEFQKRKAVADGMSAEADATRALNEAQNAMSDGTREYLVNMERVKHTQGIVGEMAKTVGRVSVTTMSGVPLPGGNGVSGGAAGASSGGNVIEQATNAILNVMMSKPVIEKVIAQLGGDPRTVAEFMPQLFGNAATGEDKGEKSVVVVPAAATLPSPASAEAGKKGGRAPAPGGLN